MNFRLRAWLTSVASLCLAAPLLAAAASSGHGADREVTNDATYRWGENKIVVNPKNPDNLVIATQGIGFTNDCQKHSPDCQVVMANLAPGIRFPQAKGLFINPNFDKVVALVSFDRGKSWKRVNIPVTPIDHSDLTGAGDPNVTVTAEGTFYFSFDDTNWGTPEQPLPDAGVAVAKSTDGGLTWSTPVLTGTPIDGPKITADLSTGTIYEASSSSLGPHSTGDAKSPQGTIRDRWLVWSKDGVHWTIPQPLGGTGMSMSAAHGMLATTFTASPQPNIFSAANGQLCDTAPQPCVVFETTTDGGAAWSRHVMPSSGPSGPSGPSGLGGPSGEPPMVAADPSHAEHFTVVVPMGVKGYEVFQTRDAGNTWSGPIVLTEDPTKIHYHSWMDYSPQGVLGIMWQSGQPPAGQMGAAPPAGGPGGGPAYPYSVWAAISRDGGATFSAPYAVSSADSPAPPTGAFGNAGDDYSSIALNGNYVYVTWADWRSKERANYFRAIKLNEFKK